MKFKGIVIFCMGVSIGCRAMTEDQQRAAWGMLKDTKIFEAPQNSWQSHMIFGRHKKELALAHEYCAQVDAAIKPSIRTTNEGLTESERYAFSSGYAAGMARDRSIYLGSEGLRKLASSNVDDQIDAERLIKHELEHVRGEHSAGCNSILELNLPAYMGEVWYRNAVRRTEFEADLAAYRGIATKKLLHEKARLEAQPNSHLKHATTDLLDTHASDYDKLLMITEELKARETGMRLPESESPASQNFFSRNLQYSPTLAAVCGE